MAHLRAPASQKVTAGASMWTKLNRKHQDPYRNNTPLVRPGQHPQVWVSQPWPSVIPLLFAQICLLKAWLLHWDNTNIYWAFCTRQTLTKPFACICALNPQISLWGKLANSVLGKLTPRKGNKSPKGIRLVNRRAGVWTQTCWLQYLSI